MENSDKIVPHSRKKAKKLGQPPGTPIYLGQQREGKIDLTIFKYDENGYEEFCAMNSHEVINSIGDDHVTWVNIDGIFMPELVKNIGEGLELHSLTIEDIMNSDHRPKVEVFEDYIHFTMKMLTYNQEHKRIDAEQISFILGDDYVLSFQETPGDVFDPIRDRIRLSKGRVRNKKADYLIHVLIDVIVDNYYIIIDHLQAEIESIEESVIKRSSEADLHSILKLKKELLFLRKSVIPVREAVSALTNTDSELVGDSTRLYLKDVYDHTLHIVDSIENYREMLNSLMDIYLTGLSNRLNNVMRILTVISTIFIPLTFIAGVYGMNFEVIPWAHEEWGFYAVSGIMLVMGVVMLFWLRHKKWL
jgi:magnesium transporter